METKQEEIDDKRLGETLDRYRNQGTQAGKVMIDRESLESIVEQRVNRALVETFEGMVDTIIQWDGDYSITLIETLGAEIEKLKS